MKATAEAMAVVAPVVELAAARVAHVELAVAVLGVAEFVGENYRSRNVIAQSWYGPSMQRRE